MYVPVPGTMYDLKLPFKLFGCGVLCVLISAAAAEYPRLRASQAGESVVMLVALGSCCLQTPNCLRRLCVMQ